jgi:acetyl-CoA carboxylase carboxyltransferase component
MPTEHCHALAIAMWDRGRCQVMGPSEAADFVFDERVHSGFGNDL